MKLLNTGDEAKAIAGPSELKSPIIAGRYWRILDVPIAGDDGRPRAQAS